jgi:hypothetical protein
MDMECDMKKFLLSVLCLFAFSVNATCVVTDEEKLDIVIEMLSTTHEEVSDADIIKTLEGMQEQKIPYAVRPIILEKMTRPVVVAKTPQVLAAKRVKPQTAKAPVKKAPQPFSFVSTWKSVETSVKSLF